MGTLESSTIGFRTFRSSSGLYSADLSYSKSPPHISKAKNLTKLNPRTDNKQATDLIKPKNLALTRSAVIPLWSYSSSLYSAFLHYSSLQCSGSRPKPHTETERKKANSDIEIPLLRWKMKDGKGCWMAWWRIKEVELEQVVDDEVGEWWRYR